MVVAEPESRPLFAPRVAELRSELRALKRTLIIAGAVLAASGIAILVSPGTGSSGPKGDIVATGSDYRIAMPTQLRAGHHTIAFTNRGTQDHELLVFQTDLPANALPLGTDGDMNEDSPLLHNVLDSGNGLHPGQSQSLSITLAPGHYVAVCNLPGHYRLGMKLDLTVTN